MNEDNSSIISTGREMAQEKHLASLAELIQQEMVKIEEYARRTVKHALLAGKLLCEAKQKVGHGNWLSWFEKQDFRFAEVTAQRYMRLYRRWPELQERIAELGNPSSLTDLSLDNALQLLANPNQISQQNVDRSLVCVESSVNLDHVNQQYGAAGICLFEQAPIPLEIRTAALAVLDSTRTICSDRAIQTALTDFDTEQAKVDTNSTLLGKVIASPSQSGESLEAISQELLLAYATGRISEAIVLLPSIVSATWYRRFKNFARVHLQNSRTDTCSESTEGSTAIYMGTQEEQFFHVFENIGDGYVPFRKVTKRRRS